jgi:hypothetical protein
MSGLTSKEIRVFVPTTLRVRTLCEYNALFSLFKTFSAGFVYNTRCPHLSMFRFPIDMWNECQSFLYCTTLPTAASTHWSASPLINPVGGIANESITCVISIHLRCQARQSARFKYYVIRRRRVEGRDSFPANLIWRPEWFFFFVSSGRFAE